jgi:adenylate cyclase
MQQEPPIETSVADGTGERKLVAVVHADVEGYSRLIGLDDKGTVARLSLLRDELIEPELRRHGASLVNTAGDSMMLTFPSITAAVRCALDFQRRVPEYDANRPPDRLLRFRIGINIADIISDHTDIHGEGVNIAARLQAICPPGGVCISRAVYDHVRGRLSLPFEPLGQLQLKNIAQPVEAFVVRLEAGAASGASRPAPAGQRRPRARQLVLAGLAGLLLIAAGSVAWWVRQQQGAIQTVNAPSTVSDDGPAPPLSIAVLPLINLSGDPEQAYLADGIAEDLTTDLSHLSGSQVIARESAFTYKGRAVDVRDVGKQLNVRYVLEGSVRKLGDIVRVNAQLIATDSGTHVWAERFDESTRDLAAGQDQIVARIGSALNVQLVQADTSRRTRKTPGNPAAFDLVLRARSALNRPSTWANYTIAAGLFEQALQLDPDSVPAMTGVASILLRAFSGKIFVKRAADLITAAEHQAPGSPDVLVAKFLLQRNEAQWEDSMATFRAILNIDSGAAGVVESAAPAGAGRRPRSRC